MLFYCSTIVLCVSYLEHGGAGVVHLAVELALHLAPQLLLNVLGQAAHALLRLGELVRNENNIRVGLSCSRKVLSEIGNVFLACMDCQNRLQSQLLARTIHND